MAILEELGMTDTLQQSLAPMREDARWSAVMARDTSFDGEFYYSVTSTGVYCRPSCAARLPKRSNVRFHDTRSDAEQAGFRPCKRCKPDQAPLAQQHADKVAEACRLIEAAEEAPKLTALAEAVGLNPHHFHRIFKATLGLAPKAYATARRNKRVREQLGRSGTVTEAIYNSGFNSNGRFYAAAPQLLGMTPTDFRSGGTNQEMRFAIGECSLGSVLIAASAKGVCAIILGDDPETLLRDLQDQFPNARLLGGDPHFEQLTAKVVGFVETPSLGLDLPLDVRGTAFQHRVWEALRRIPAGCTASYAEIAEAIGSPKSARGVARACAANRIAVAIPCHRVVRTDGALSGYRWGIERKRALLDKEARAKP
jgi:AraC family transcriptional regulator, regulatory protein of adaptative response / methylated-DNA-[protein]-cysteine methyltransferase